MKRRDLLIASASCGLLLLGQSQRWAQAMTAADDLAAYPPMGPVDSPPPHIKPLIRTGINVDLSAADVFGQPVVVWADRVRLLGTITTAGFPLTIVAREIEFTANSLIDSRITSPVPHFPQPASAGSGGAPGSSGKDGSNGGDGGDAGDVELVAQTILGLIAINASGQSGGDAESGGDGQRGANAAGYGNKRGTHCKKGQKGGPGGIGGLTGRPGYGGNGGKVAVRAAHFDRATANILVAPGAAGNPGRHGRPGEGGDGGAGGSALYNSHDGPRGKER